MDLSPRTLRIRLLAAGLLPRTRLARAACYLLGSGPAALRPAEIPRSLQTFLGYGPRRMGRHFKCPRDHFDFPFLAYRWLKAKLMWRLRNRLIVTYMFIGVIPVILLVAMAFIAGTCSRDSSRTLV